MQSMERGIGNDVTIVVLDFGRPDREKIIPISWHHITTDDCGRD